MVNVDLFCTIIHSLTTISELLLSGAVQVASLAPLLPSGDGVLGPHHEHTKLIFKDVNTNIGNTIQREAVYYTFKTNNNKNKSLRQ